MLPDQHAGDESLQVLSRRQVAALLGVSAATLGRMVHRGEFPAPIRLSRGRVGWRRATVERWLAEREAATSQILRAPDAPASPRRRPPATGRRVPQ